MNTTISSFYINTATMQKQPKMVRLGVVLTVTQITEEPDEVKVSRPVL